MRTWMSVVAVLGLVTGCGDDFGGEVKGTVGGQTLDVKEAVFMTVPVGIGANFQLVYLSDRDGLCETLKTLNTKVPRDATILELLMLNVDADGEVGSAGVGTYSIVDPSTDTSALAGRLALGNFIKTGPQCESVLSGEQGTAMDGAIELSELESGDDGFAEGRFDMQFGPGATERLEGDFKARPCELPASFFEEPTSSPTCG